MANQQQGRGQQTWEPAYRCAHQWSAEEVDSMFEECTPPPQRFRPPTYVNRKRGAVDRYVLHDGINIWDIIERLPITIPATAVGLLGYHGNSRFIGLFYDTHHGRPVITDGAVSCLGCSQAWDVIHNQRAIQEETSSLNFYSRLLESAHHCYLLDRKEHALYVGEYEPITEFLEIWTADVEIDLENVKRLRRMAYEIYPPHQLTRREQELFIQQRKIVISYCTQLEQALANP